MTNKECYYQVKELLSQVGVSCCGYTEAGQDLTIYNNVAQLTIMNDKHSDLCVAVSQFIKTWID